MRALVMRIFMCGSRVGAIAGAMALYYSVELNTKALRLEAHALESNDEFLILLWYFQR